MDASLPGMRPTPPSARALRVSIATTLALVVTSGLAQDLRGTKHNLSGREDLPTSEAGQICVYCHTPAFSSTGVRHEPLWQRNLAEEFSFPLYDDIGRMGLAGSSAVGSQSIACLSCHDSVQAFSVTRIAAIDHPFGIPYRGALNEQARERAVAAARASGNPMHEARRIVAEEFRPAQRSVIDNRPVWWTSKRVAADRRGRDDLPLYVRRDADDGSEIPFVECASCHNPHSDEKLFLRMTADSGNLCQTCHVK